MEQRLESLEYSIGPCRGYLRQDLSHLCHEVAANLDRGLCGLIQQDKQQLEPCVLSKYFLVDQMGNHLRCGYADDFVIPLKRPPKLDHHSFQDQVPNLGEFCVYDCN